jgi:polyisoprenoid-binding protein YceI
MKNQKFEIVAAQSNIHWTGRKVTGAHNGTIAIKKGTLLLKDGKLEDGRFIIDTTSIKVLDVTDPATNAQFTGHLASDDFFASAQYPEANFKITAVKNNRIEGDLTIKGITRPVEFHATVSHAGDTLVAYGQIVIDRTQFGIRFRSGNFFKDLGDTLIYNEFDLNVTITAKAVAATALV